MYEPDKKVFYFVVPMGVFEAAIASYFGCTSYAVIALTM